MSRKVTSQKQRWLIWSHLFSVMISIGAGVLICWISGGFPPTTWQMLWLVLSQVQMLWRHGALSLILQLAILAVQSLLLLFVWLVCLWIICIEVIAFMKYVFEPVLLKSRFLSEIVDNLYFVVRAPLRIFSQRQTASTSSGADPSFALSATANLTPPAGIAGGPEWEKADSNIINPFAPDHLRWFQPSPDLFSTRLQKVLSGKFPALSVQGLEKAGFAKSNSNSKSLSEEEILQNPFEEPTEKMLQNPFEEPEGEMLRNPFEELKEVSWQNPFEESKEVSWQNPFERLFTENSDIADQETLVPANRPPIESEEQNGDASLSVLSDVSLMEDSTATLPDDLDTKDDIPVVASSTLTPTRSPDQSLLASYCAEPEETEGDTAHLELCATRTISGGGQLLSGLYIIVSGPGETSTDDTISSQVIKTMREQLEPLQNGTYSNEELKELFFVTGQHGYEQFLQKVQKQERKQKKDYTITGILVLQEPGVNLVSYTAHVVHCGSSQLYYYSASKGLKRITNEEEVETLLTEQSLASEEGQLSASQNEWPFWHLEMSTMTKISTFSLPLQPRDRLLLCGSGLWNALLDRELAAFLALPVRNPMQIATLLQQAAIEANHQEQIMAMVVFIPQ